MAGTASTRRIAVAAGRGNRSASAVLAGMVEPGWVSRSDSSGVRSRYQSAPTDHTVGR